jgi:thioredoxin 1
MDIEEIRRKKLKELMKKMMEESAKPVRLDESSFDAFIAEHENVVVDFWAEWCGPCRMIAPMIDELAKEYAGKVRFAKLNVDEARSVALRFSISAIPTLIFFKRGKPVDAIIGAYPKSELKRWIERNL